MLGSPSRKIHRNRRPAKRQTTPQLTKGNMQVRVVTLAVLTALVFLVLGSRLWYMQVLSGDSFNEAAQQTQTREVKIPAQRGVIYDRDLDVLASNVPGLNVTVVPDEISREKVRELAEIVGANVETVTENYDEAKIYDPYSAMLVKENAEESDITYVSERSEEFPGLVINDDWVRKYPEGTLASHVVGYTGAVTQEELDQERFKGIWNDSVVGKTGVEYTYEEELRGKAGSTRYTVDALGRVVTVRNADGTRADGGSEIAPELLAPNDVEDPIAGGSLVLTLDIELQRAAEEELDAAILRAQQEGYSGEGGAVVAMDPRDGEILAMASRPDFDPQLFVGGINSEDEIDVFDYLNSESSNSPFTNRAIVGAYPGASAFKVFTGLAGFLHGVVDANTTVTDNGACWAPASAPGACWYSWKQTYDGEGATHGTQNFAQAVADSNDKYFYQVADWIWQQTDDVNLLPDFYEQFGFGSTTGVDLPGETEGRIPTREWFDWFKEEIGSTDDRPWGIADWVNMSIGQGDVLVSPVQMAQAYAAVENGGTLVTPHVAKEIRNQFDNKVQKEFSPEAEGKVEFDPAALSALTDGLRGVTGPEGTAAPAFADSELTVLGKSGTGERGDTQAPVAWFTGWAEGQDRPLVVVVMLEGSGSSEVTAAPAVRGVLEAHYGVESGGSQSGAAAAASDPAAYVQ
ncbi:MAG: penicillin-binding protein 2 [Rubrobacter sp.]